MRNKTKKNIILVIAVLVVGAALILNIFISRPNTTRSYSVLKEIKKVYFSESDIPPENLIAFKDYINSPDPNGYVQALNLPNPIYKFYGICGLIRLHHKMMSTQLANLLVNETGVTMVNNGAEQSGTLADATLRLVTDMPKWLVGQKYDGFYVEIAESLSMAFGSNYAANNKAYRNSLISLITQTNPTLLKELYAKLNIEEPYSSKTYDEKLALIRELDTCDAIKRKNSLTDLLQDKNGTLINGAINNIKETDDAEIAALLNPIMFNSAMGETIQLNAMEKYALILKADSIEEIQRFMKEKAGSKQSILLKGIEMISLYSNKSISYDFLKIYLAANFGDKVNEAAIKAIVKTSIQEDRDNVLGTMAFVLNKSSYSAAKYVIEWVLESEQFLLFRPTMERFRRYENDEMKMLAIRYIQFQKAKSGIDIITTLSTDPNPNISSAASALLKDKTVFPQ